jgi:hypothetical protein
MHTCCLPAAITCYKIILFCISTFIHVRFQVLTAASMMFRVVFWVVLPCKMIVDRRTASIIRDGGSTHL